MKEMLVRHCGPGDYAGVVKIYNHYIEHSCATFDVAPYSVGARVPWFAQFAETGPHQLLVAVSCDKVVGFCCSSRFKSRPAYAVSVETTAYVAPDAVGRGIGETLYKALFAGLDRCDLHGAYAGITLPNDASVKLHQKLGFRQIGVFEEVGRKFDKYWSVAWFEKRI
jgi:phosphinothricin acetyltransferase